MPSKPERTNVAGRDPVSRRSALLIAAIILIVSTILLFARLGHYALWDDEAITAVVGHTVWRTGDTGAISGHNLVAYRGGAELKDLKLRYHPPLQYYLTAPFLGLLGQNAWAARLPYALCGLGTIAVMCAWISKARSSLLAWVLMAIGILGNVSLFLFSRQCRYYAVSLLTTIAIAFLYVHWNGRWRRLIAIGALLFVLLCTNYLNYAALCGCLVVDYFIWGRHNHRLQSRQWLALLISQVIAAAVIVQIWNPIGKSAELAEPYSESWLSDRLTLLWWSIRDMNACEFGSAIAIIGAMVIAVVTRNSLMRRASLALAVYIVLIVLTCPQLMASTSVADVRYFVPIIPLCIAMTVGLLLPVTKRIAGLGIFLAVIIFGTNLLHGGMFLFSGVQSTIGMYVIELFNPPPESYTVTARWIDEHVQAGQSVWVIPDHMTYPLMFLSPHPVYAWQLHDSRDPQFRGLDEVHFVGHVAPEYVIAFGPAVKQLQRGLPLRPGGPRVSYVRASHLKVYWRDLYRPELFWRSFRPLDNVDFNVVGVHIFKRQLLSDPTTQPTAQ
jgi:4-amino-4-deoxy-L-arabinose transferase-like glycosyltransferase